MAAGTQSRVDPDSDAKADDRPEIAVCESTPGTSVFLESGNTDGWIASDATVEVGR
jgi:hypothetical protein